MRIADSIYSDLHENVQTDTSDAQSFDCPVVPLEDTDFPEMPIEPLFRSDVFGVELPLEIQLLILRNLVDVEDVDSSVRIMCRLCSVCKQFRYLASQDSLWSVLLETRQIGDKVDTKAKFRKQFNSFSDSFEMHQLQCRKYMQEHTVSCHYLFKVIFCGHTKTGKSNIIERFLNDTFTPTTKPTIGVEFALREILIRGNLCHLQCWDTSGQERYRGITTGYYRNAAGAVLVYSVTDRQSFAEVQTFLGSLEDQLDAETLGNGVLLIGNKMDQEQERQVSTEEGLKFAKDHKIKLFGEVSALQGKNIEKLMFSLIANIVQYKKQRGEYHTSLLNGVFPEQS